jgi:hypothetical protein
MIASFSSYILFHTSYARARYVSKEVARNEHVYMLVISTVVIIVLLFLYYFLSREFLTNKASFFKNIMSLSLTGVIGIALWLAAFCIDLTGGTQMRLYSQFWQLYKLYYGYCIFLVDVINPTNPYIMLASGILPIVAMYLGVKKSKATETGKSISG